MYYEEALQRRAKGRIMTTRRCCIVSHSLISMDATFYIDELVEGYSVTRFPPDGIVKRKKPPCASRVHTTVRVKNARRKVTLLAS